jgi:O-antigen/teichoic acid export membrane protein
MRELFGYSKWLQLANIVSFASARAADFVIGRMAGASALGIFSVGKEISNLPSAELATPIHRGVFPGYAKLAADRSLLKRAYLKVSGVLLLMVLPAGIGLGLVAEPVVMIFFGANWVDMAPLIRILSINGVLSVSLSTAAYIYLALGTPRHTTTLVAVYAGVSITLMLWLMPTAGIRGAAIAMLIGTAATAPLNFRYMSDAVSLTLRDLARIAWRPATATLVMVGAVSLVARYLGPARTLHENFVLLATAAFLGAAVYCVTLTVLWRLASPADSAEAFVLERLKSAAAAMASRVRAARET